VPRLSQKASTAEGTEKRRSPPCPPGYWFRLFGKARRDTLCTVSEWACLSTVDRFMWDGHQIVAEFRVPGADSLSEDALKRGQFEVRWPSSERGRRPD
jgi:hypothetical protein